MPEKAYPWTKIRQVLLNLKFSEIITTDNDVLFFQHSQMGLAKLRKYKEGVDQIQIQVICSNINYSFDDFISLIENT